MQPMNQFTDPNNTTVLVGGLSGYVTEDELRSFFQGFGEIRYLGTRVKIPPGKGGGFVQFVHRHSALPRWRSTRCRFSPGAVPRTTLAGSGCLRWLGDDVRNMPWGERWGTKWAGGVQGLVAGFWLGLGLGEGGIQVGG
jgi:RNA recognition motif-containing protein